MINLRNAGVVIPINEGRTATKVVAEPGDGCGQAPAYRSINRSSHFYVVAVEIDCNHLFQNRRELFGIANLGRAMTHVQVGKDYRRFRGTHLASPTTLTAIYRCVGR